MTHVELQGCPLKPAARALERRIDGVYTAVTFSSSCSPAEPPSIRYGVMNEADPTHRGLARIVWANQERPLQVLVPQVRALTRQAIVDARLRLNRLDGTD